MRTLVWVLLLGFWFGVAGSPVFAAQPDASASPALTVAPVVLGGRVEVPEAGYALTLPDEWLVVRPMAGDLEDIVAGVREVAPPLAAIVESGMRGGMSLTLMAFGPGDEGGATIQSCNVLTVPVGELPMETVLAAELAAFERAGEAIVEGPELRVFDSMLGDVWRIDYRMDYLGNERDVSSYFFPPGPDSRSTLTCGLSERPDDAWLSIAETFEFLLAEE